MAFNFVSILCLQLPVHLELLAAFWAGCRGGFLLYIEVTRRPRSLFIVQFFGIVVDRRESANGITQGFFR